MLQFRKPLGGDGLSKLQVEQLELNAQGSPEFHLETMVL